MKKLFLVFAVLCAGVFLFGRLNRVAEQNRKAVAERDSESDAIARRLVETQKVLAALRADTPGKRNRLREASRHPNINPALLQLLERNGPSTDSAAWFELRAQLGIGWNSSSDYVLVNKRVLKQLEYARLYYGTRPTDDAASLLSLSTDERSAIRSILEAARDDIKSRIERTPPSGDIVAQYSIAPPDPVTQQALGNDVSAAITEAIGSERAGFLFPQAWREFNSQSGSAQAETLTVRRTVIDGEPDLIYETTRDGQVYGPPTPVRFAASPSSWFSTEFPGGWQTMAEREGFELPAHFKNN